jgi:hypothetical protein
LLRRLVAYRGAALNGSGLRGWPLLGFSSHGALCVQVRGSTDEKKREFLVQKGLTDEEIEEAYKRVPPAPPVSTVLSPSPLLLLPGQA